MKKLIKHLIPGLAAIILLAFAACSAGGGEVGSGGNDSDTTPPVVAGSISFNDIKSDSVTVWWPAAVDNDTAETSLSYKLVVASSAEAIDTITEINAVTGESLLIDWEYDARAYSEGGLQGLTEYYFAVLVKDWAGNTSIYLPQKVKTLDGIAPTPGGNVGFSNIAVNSVQVSWNAATDNSFEQSGLSYRLVRASTAAAIDTVEEANSSASGITVVMNWTVNALTYTSGSLSEGNTYYYAVLVRDGDGNMAIYSPQSVTTLDVTSPTAGSEITFTNETANSVTVNWGAGTDNGTSQSGLRYKVVCASTAEEIDTIAEADAFTSAGVVMDWTANTLSCSATGLTHGTFYYFAVLVEDGAGNMAIYSPRSLTTVTAQWASIVTDDDPSNGTMFESMCIDGNGNIFSLYLASGDPHHFGNGVNITPPNNTSCGILVKYNSSGVAQWAQTIVSGTGFLYYTDVCLDNSGNIYVVGFIYNTGTFNFGNGVTATGTSGVQNVLLIKYNASGVAQWARTVSSGTAASYFRSVSIDSSGNIYAGGQIKGTGTFNFGNGISTAGTYTNNNMLLVKYNASGVAQWAKSVTSGTGESILYDVAVDGSGNVCIAGNINGTGTYGFGNSVTATGTYTYGNILLVKYNTAGVTQWARTVSAGNSSSSFRSLCTDSGGNIYAAGGFEGTGTFNFGNSNSVSGVCPSNTLIVKYNSSGVTQWVRTVSAGPYSSGFRSICIDNNNYIYTAGTVSKGIWNFGYNVTASGIFNDYNTIIVKYDSSGKALWSKSILFGPDNSYLENVCVGSNGQIIAGGDIEGDGIYNFGNGVTLTGCNNSNPGYVCPFIIKYQQ